MMIKNPNLLKNIVFKSLKILDEMSRKGFVHGSLRPQNILLTENSVRFADFSKSHQYLNHHAYDYDDDQLAYLAPEIIDHAIMGCKKSKFKA